MKPVVEVRDLRRTYRTSTGILKRRSIEIEAVRGVSFEIAEGELFGLLGPNGAGKTTTIKMLITLLIPTSGTAHVLGLDVVKDAHGVTVSVQAQERRKTAGISPRPVNLYGGLHHPPAVGCVPTRTKARGEAVASA